MIYDYFSLPIEELMAEVALSVRNSLVVRALNWKILFLIQMERGENLYGM